MIISLTRKKNRRFKTKDETGTRQEETNLTPLSWIEQAMYKFKITQEDQCSRLRTPRLLTNSQPSLACQNSLSTNKCWEQDRPCDQKTMWL